MKSLMTAAVLAAALMVPGFALAQTAGSQAKGEPTNAAVKATSQDPNKKDAMGKKAKKSGKKSAKGSKS